MVLFKKKEKNDGLNKDCFNSLYSILILSASMQIFDVFYIWE